MKQKNGKQHFNNVVKEKANKKITIKKMPPLSDCNIEDIRDCAMISTITVVAVTDGRPFIGLTWP